MGGKYKISQYIAQINKIIKKKSNIKKTDSANSSNQVQKNEKNGNNIINNIFCPRYLIKHKSTKANLSWTLYESNHATRLNYLKPWLWGQN